MVFTWGLFQSNREKTDIRTESSWYGFNCAGALCTSGHQYTKTYSPCSGQLVLCATDCALCHTPSVPNKLGTKCLEDTSSSLWPDINICSCTTQQIITTVHFYSAVLSRQQRRRLPCCCTGSCCSGRTGPWGISSTTPVRASGNARRTWVVKSSTTSTRARQVDFYSFISYYSFDWLQAS